jgi:hypothetical protein
MQFVNRIGIYPCWMHGAPFLITRWLDPSSLKRRPWTAQIISICLSCLQPRRWPTFNRMFFINKLVSLHTAAVQWESFGIKLLQIDGLGGKYPCLGPLAPPIYPQWIWGGGGCKGPGIQPKVGSVVELRARINSAVPSATSQMLENKRREIECRLYILWAAHGAHIEKYWTWRVVLSSKATQFFVSHILCVMCVLEIWWINRGHSVYYDFVTVVGHCVIAFYFGFELWRSQKYSSECFFTIQIWS